MLIERAIPVEIRKIRSAPLLAKGYSILNLLPISAARIIVQPVGATRDERLNKNQTSQEERHEDRMRSIHPFACCIPRARTERQDHAHRLAPRRTVRERPRDHFRGPDRRPLSLRRGAERNWWQ